MSCPVLTTRSRRVHAAVAAAALLNAAAGLAQQTTVLSPVVVTGTRVEQPSFDLPMAVDRIDGAAIQEQQAQVGIAETMARVPGTVVQNRETYSQEQQVIIRGFGARSTFGVRGIRLYADGIPASTPDGQGGSGLFDLASAQRIEVLRGPFSALYGNHSGGVIQIFTEDGPPRPTLSSSLLLGSYHTERLGFKFGGQAGALNYIGSASRFDTEGYRDWSSARKELANVKLSMKTDAGTSWTLIGNSLNQPDNRDPLGLTAAQLAQNRRQAQPVALTFQTRRNLDNLQGGLVLEHPLSGQDTLRAIAYTGTRSNEQYLAIPLGAQGAATSSGGVSAFYRQFWGAGLRWTHARPGLTATVGVDYERADDDRKGYINNNGTRGALKRDEENAVWQAGLYGQLEWALGPKWSASAGLRYTKVDFRSDDHFIVLGNPDDSGKASFGAWTPVVGVLYRLTDTVNLYANAGRSFEAPTFIELAYKADGTSGLNLALKASESDHYEAGLKAILGRDARLTLAVFQINTRDEIVVDTNVGGRTTFRNAGRTSRRGLELALDYNLGGGFSAYGAATYLDARFRDGFAGTGGTVNSGNRIPAVPNHSLYGELQWRHAPLGFRTAIELRRSGKVYADDTNAVTADGYNVVNLRAGFEQRLSGWRFTEFLRIDNLTDKEYIGAVYVNDGNSRFFAPAAKRNYLLGLSAAYTF